MDNRGSSVKQSKHSDVWFLAGFETDELSIPVWLGGESEALARLERHLQRKAWVASFAKPKMSPQSLLASPYGLSPYLRFGCLSTRNFYHRLTRLYISVSPYICYSLFQ